MKVDIEPKAAIIVTSDDGGYLSGRCIVCGAHGWREGKLGRKYGDKKNPGSDLVHKKGCPMNKEIEI